MIRRVSVMRNNKYYSNLKSLLLLLPAFTVSLAPAQAEDGAALYQRCAACHLAGGEGVPGAFPPLKNRIANIASTDLGRAYLVKVVNKGLMGPLTISGQMYMGVMPAQGAALNAEQMTTLMNYLVQTLDKDFVSKEWAPYTLAEVQALIDEGGTTMSNAELRKALFNKHPE